MPAAGRVRRAVLEVLDPRSGGTYSADEATICLHLGQRGIAVDRKTLTSVLEELVELGTVERVMTEDRVAVYTRPAVLLGASGLVRVHRHRSPRAP